MAGGKTDIGKRGLRALKRIAPIEELEGQRHILDGGHGRDQMEGLKHDADGTASRLRQLVLVHSREVLAGDKHLPCGRGFEPGHDHQEGRFA